MEKVAFLIRRLLNKLDISRDKSKIYLTSASVPKIVIKKLQKFANLTAQKSLRQIAYCINMWSTAKIGRN